MGYFLFFLLCALYAIPAILVIIGILRKKDDRIILLISGTILSFGFYILPCERPDIIIGGALVLFGLLYFLFLQPRAKKVHDDAVFDSRVLGFIDGLDFSEIPFRCTSSQLRHYVEARLAEAHKLPDNAFLIIHTTAQGYTYRSKIGRNDHMLFALLCIAEYAEVHGNEDLLNWSESNMRNAERGQMYY